MEKDQDLALQLKAIIDTAIDGIITIDRNGIVETLNAAAAGLFGYQSDEVIGQNIKFLMPDPYRKEHDEYISRYHTTKEPRIIGIGREVVGKRKDGSIFPFRLAVSEVVLNDRLIFTGIVHDLSEVKKAQEEIVQLNTKLEQKVTQRTYELETVVNKLLSTNSALEKEISYRTAIEAKLRSNEEELKVTLQKEKDLNELKSRFVSMASHEFRTPLTSILSSAALIGRYEQPENQEARVKHINKIKSAVTNLTGILNDFLSLSKLEEGKVEVTLTELDLPQLCVEVVEELKGLYKPNQKINHNTYGNPNHVLVDERILKNVLFNLISNAIKYSEKDIECDITFNHDNYEITVRDRGIGIPLADQKYLFSRFFRAGNVTNIQGTGLGLNIVKSYVKMINGNIKFESVPEEGTTFTVTIPYQQKGV